MGQEPTTGSVPYGLDKQFAYSYLSPWAIAVKDTRINTLMVLQFHRDALYCWEEHPITHLKVAADKGFTM